MKSMRQALEETLNGIWIDLAQKIQCGDEKKENRIYRRLDLEKDNGVRLGVSIPGYKKELLIELADRDRGALLDPAWAGLAIKTIDLDIHQNKIPHLMLSVLRQEHESVFLLVCADIVVTLINNIKPEHRAIELNNCLDKWSRFFHKHGFDGLGIEAQRGLFGELFWMQQIINAGMNKNNAVKAWQGCLGAYHDYIYQDRAIEVKTTISKEPRKVIINNEKQLDSRAFEIMVLYVLSLQPLPSGGLTLPSLIKGIRSALSDNTAANFLFEQSLYEAGYIDLHEYNYNDNYIIKKEEAFLVRDGFPRIIDMPSGTGDLSYSVTISSCYDHLIDTDFAKRSFIGGG